MQTEREDTTKRFLYVNERKPVWKPALLVASQYLVFGVLWITLSDTIVNALIADDGLRLTVTLSKGIVYVLLSALIIYSLVARVLKKLGDKEQIILENRNELKVMLYYDHLTGLSNRRKLIERLPEYLNDGTSRSKALLYIDVDDIKLINDTMGHTFGDELIVTVSKTIAAGLMKGEELYRLGGDEFIVLMKFDELTDAQERAMTIMESFEKPLSIENTLIHCTISIGVSVYPRHCADPGELLKFADIAMYEAKNNGKKQAVIYNPGMMNAINERMSIGEYLHDAMTKNELEVFFQPQFEMESRRIASFEALLRWNNHILGKVSPDKFISVAEETHLIIPIGKWILRESCLFVKSLHEGGFPDITVSVNISMIQLLQEDFVDTVLSTLEETGLAPKYLDIEITETIVMESWAISREKLERLRSHGIGVALDDFGKGYSSLSYLAQLPITILKIDKIFIDGIVEGGQDASLTGNIVEIGRKLGLTVIAEGVETDGQLLYLEREKCDRVQGWIFSKALPAVDARRLLEKHAITAKNA
jgi:diguanylate cyclase (GGDEF)-like protein